MVWTGALLGLAYFNLAAWTAPTPAAFDARPPAAEAPDPWAESRKSAEILRGQEAAPVARPQASATRGAPAGDLASLRVVDGDTFRLGGETIRIADIDTPELRARCPEEAALAGRATRRLQALLMQAPFELSPIGGRDEDRYGRKLRIVTRGGRSLGDVLVAEGLARTWTGRREPWCA
jgi:endonuclease YncB( thermonuclease family)